MEIDDLRKLTTEQLEKEKKEVEFILVTCHQNITKPLVKVGKRKDVKKRLARINTLLRERKNEN